MKCACNNKRPHPWEPGESCPPERVDPLGPHGEKGVEAAMHGFVMEGGRLVHRMEIRAALEAALPFLVADAKREVEQRTIERDDQRRAAQMRGEQLEVSALRLHGGVRKAMREMRERALGYAKETGIPSAYRDCANLLAPLLERHFDPTEYGPLLPESDEAQLSPEIKRLAAEAVAFADDKMQGRDPDPSAMNAATEAALDAQPEAEPGEGKRR